MVRIRRHFVGLGGLDICYGWTVFLLAEILNSWQIAGSIVVLVGILLAKLGTR